MHLTASLPPRAGPRVLSHLRVAVGAAEPTFLLSEHRRIVFTPLLVPSRSETMRRASSIPLLVLWHDLKVVLVM
jgi:hypothetical protein